MSDISRHNVRGVDYDLKDASARAAIVLLEGEIAGKQDELVSGENIKTVNHQSLLGEGNVDIDISGKADRATTLAGYGITNAYTKAEVNSLISTPAQNYVTVSNYDDLPETGSSNTIYRVSGYDGVQSDPTKYAEYAWTGTRYMLLSVKSNVGIGYNKEVIDNYASGGTVTATLVPNTYYVFAVPVGRLNISFSNGASNLMCEYMFQFTCPAGAGTDLSFSSEPLWTGEELAPERGMTYQVSILNELGVYAGWEAAGV